MSISAIDRRRKAKWKPETPRSCNVHCHTFRSQHAPYQGVLSPPKNDRLIQAARNNIEKAERRLPSLPRPSQSRPRARRVSEQGSFGTLVEMLNEDRTTPRYTTPRYQPRSRFSWAESDKSTSNVRFLELSLRALQTNTPNASSEPC